MPDQEDDGGPGRVVLFFVCVGARFARCEAASETPPASWVRAARALRHSCSGKSLAARRVGSWLAPPRQYPRHHLTNRKRSREPGALDTIEGDEARLPMHLRPMDGKVKHRLARAV